MMGLVMFACEGLGIREPMEFYATVSPASQELWLEHARNKVTGQYTRTPKGAAGNTPAHVAAEIERAAIEGASHGPR